jgi:very-short-patch-repair endonuclease
MTNKNCSDSDQKLNPPQSPLVRGEASAPPPSMGGGARKRDAVTPPLTRGGGEGLRTGEALTSRVGLGFLPYNPKLTELARVNRQNPTAAELKIWKEVLRQRQFADYKFLRQKPIDEFIVDFYCSTLQLVIEIDGDSHAEAVEYDAARTGILSKHGLTLIRYTNNDVLQNISGVYDDLVLRVGAIKRTIDTK